MLLETEARVANLLLYLDIPLTWDFNDHSVTVRLVSLLARPSLSPRAWRGFSQGSAHFMTVAPFMVSATGGVEATSLASTAQVMCLMSLLTGMFERNLIPFLVIGLAKPSGGIPLFRNPPSNIFPLNGDSMGLARGWIELEG